MFEKLPKPNRALIKRLFKAGAQAGRVVVETGHDLLATGAAEQAARMRDGHDPVDVEQLVDRVIRSHVFLARSEGAAAGASTSAAEFTATAGTGGTMVIPAVATITVADLTGLAWIQLRMTLLTAALYGHDPADRARIREFLMLQGALNSGPIGAAPLSAGAQRMGKRLLLRHLRGKALETITALFRTVGIRFSRAALIRSLFLLNIPVNMAVNDGATRRLGAKARLFYREMPPGTVTSV